MQKETIIINEFIWHYKILKKIISNKNKFFIFHY